MGEKEDFFPSGAISFFGLLVGFYVFLWGLHIYAFTCLCGLRRWSYGQG
ncbi:MAG: hypothetical protein Q9N34_08650 [Aquificota bacterium]|nr:hypothetical protein [Aquificota bacterium]